MKPIRLEICGFGPFTDATVIDFSLLGDSGLYLITGDTGSGKTTIFDAISFALFGEASGEARDDTMLRCRFSSPNTPTYIDMDFIYRGEAYNIRRNPRYLRPSKRNSEDFVEQKANAVFKTPKKVHEGVAECNEAIESLIGLSKDQFCRIAMIAQGDFLKLLFASTKERIEIFRKLFKTDKYKELAEKLGAANREVKDEYTRVKIQLEQQLKSVIPPVDSPQKAEFQRIVSEGFVDFKEPQMLMELFLEEDNNLIEENCENLEDVQKEIDKIKTLRTNAQQYFTAKSRIEQLKDELAISQKALTEAENEVEKVKAVEEKLNGMVKEDAKAREDLPKYEKADQLQKEVTKAIEEIEALGRIICDLNESNKRLQKKKSELEKKQEVILPLTEKHNSYLLEIEKLNLRKEQFVQLDKDFNSFCNKSEEYNQTLEEYRLVYAEYEKQNELWRLMNKSYFDEQAGILASNLEAGMPCPVCGALEHPHLANVSDNAPSKVQIDKKEQICRTLMQRAAVKSEIAHSLKGKCDFLKESLLKRLNNILPESSLETCGQDIKSALNENKIALEIKLCECETMAEHIADAQNATEELEAVNKEILENGKELAETEKTLSYQKANSEITRKQLSDMRAELTYQSTQELEQYISRLQRDISHSKSMIETAKANHASWCSKVASIKSGIKELKQTIPQGEYQSIQYYDEIIRELTDNKEVVDAQLLQINHRLETNRSALNSFKTIILKAEEIEKRWSVTKSLSDTASGNISGREKINIETFAQISYFERIVRRANLRLMAMTGGRYELTRDVNSNDRKHQSGLELNVIDHHKTGTVRSVKSLSGGESFKASLALALGLADEIQSNSGGIKLDTMFIDEGFGSLDEDSLQSAITTLKKLGDSNKLIGIISHVSSLKTAIDRQIVVEHNDMGSCVSIEA